MGIPDTYSMPISITMCTAVTRGCSAEQDKEQMDPIHGGCFNITSLFFNGKRNEVELIKTTSIATFFTAKQLKKATNNYSHKNILGEGGFGIVYKGILPTNQVIAVKKSWRGNSKTIVDEVINEIKVLSQIRNKNVTKLLGVCLDTELPILVFEYISNHTLYHHLHDEQKVRLLTWDVRLRIGTQIAEVLAYLHDANKFTIIHRDIKSSNILLDDNYIVKVSDFGLSRLVVPNQDQLNTIAQGDLNSYLREGTWSDTGTFTPCVVGTLGYMDPEYATTGRLSTKSDVYSFGVVLVELITGEKAYCFMRPNDEPQDLATSFVSKMLEDRWLKILEDERWIEQLKKVADVARRCLELKQEDRPPMSEVVRELQDIRGIHAHQSSSLNNTHTSNHQLICSIT